VSEWRLELRHYNEPEVHVIEDIWDIDIDGDSICGVEYHENTGRTAKLTFISDGWTDSHIMNVPAGWLYKGFHRLLATIYRYNEIYFRGFIRANDLAAKKIELVGGHLWEITLNTVDLFCVLKAFGEKMTKVLTANEHYNGVSEIIRSYNEIISVNQTFFAGLLQPVLEDNYNPDAWSGWNYTNLEMFNRASHDLPAVINDNYSISGVPFVRTKVLKLSYEEENALCLTYVDYCSYAKEKGIIGHSVYNREWSFHQLLKYAIWRIKDISLLPEHPVENAPLYQTKVDRCAYNPRSGENEAGQNLREWVAGLEKLNAYIDMTQGSQYELIQPGPKYYNIRSGVLYFTGRAALTEFFVAENKEIPLNDWIKLLSILSGAVIRNVANRISISIKSDMDNSPYFPHALDDIMLADSFSIQSNYFNYGRIDTDVSFIVNGDVTLQVINNFYAALMNIYYTNIADLSVCGYKPEVGIRYYSSPWLLYAIEAKHDINNDNTRIKALARNLNV